MNPAYLPKRYCQPGARITEAIVAIMTSVPVSTSRHAFDDLEIPQMTVLADNAIIVAPASEKIIRLQKLHDWLRGEGLIEAQIAVRTLLELSVLEEFDGERDRKLVSGMEPTYQVYLVEGVASLIMRPIQVFDCD